jgi:hypothetical protein
VRSLISRWKTWLLVGAVVVPVAWARRGGFTSSRRPELERIEEVALHCILEWS